MQSLFLSSQKGPHSIPKEGIRAQGRKDFRISNDRNNQLRQDFQKGSANILEKLRFTISRFVETAPAAKESANIATMKLDPKAIRYLTSEDFRVLAAVCPATPPSALSPSHYWLL